MAIPRRVCVLHIALIAVLSACGGGADAETNLPPAALEGRGVYRSSGCGACHGANGGGQVGPSLVGLLGAEVVLQDGTTIVADQAYLAEAIADPRAKLVEGFNLPMPTNNLTDEEIESIIDYIAALTVDEDT